MSGGLCSLELTRSNCRIMEAHSIALLQLRIFNKSQILSIEGSRIHTAIPMPKQGILLILGLD